MKNFLLGTVGLVALMTAPVSAADLAALPYMKAPPPVVAAIYDWSGFYIGINAGGGSSHNCSDLVNDGGMILTPPEPLGCHDATGGTAGGQIGYRWQASSWMFGLEAQGNWADFKGSHTNLVHLNIRNESKINAFGLFTGQVGYAWNNVMFYVKGGAAVTDDKYTGFDVPSGLVFNTASETRWGGVVGAGLEFGFAPNWSLGVEYVHMFMGNRDVTFHGVGNFGSAPGEFVGIARNSQDVDLGSVRLNYRWGGPVVAKY